MQEVVLAPEILLQCGDFEFGWNKDRLLWMHVDPYPGWGYASLYDLRVARTSRHLKDVAELHTSNTKALYIILWALRLEHPDTIARDIMEALPEMQSQVCKNPLDRIYRL